MTIAKNAPAVCRHCADPRKTVNRPRGLCWHCYYTPGVKEMYESVAPQGRRGVGHNHDKQKPDPRGGTAHPPGSVGKAAVMAERAKLGYHLCHPDDAKDYTNAAPDEAPKNPADQRRRNKKGGYQRRGKKRSRRERQEAEEYREPRGTVHGIYVGKFFG